VLNFLFIFSIEPWFQLADLIESLSNCCPCLSGFWKDVSLRCWFLLTVCCTLRSLTIYSYHPFLFTSSKFVTKLTKRWLRFLNVLQIKSCIIPFETAPFLSCDLCALKICYQHHYETMNSSTICFNYLKIFKDSVKSILVSTKHVIIQMVWITCLYIWLENPVNIIFLFFYKDLNWLFLIL